MSPLTQNICGAFWAVQVQMEQSAFNMDRLGLWFEVILRPSLVKCAEMKAEVGGGKMLP